MSDNKIEHRSVSASLRAGDPNKWEISGVACPYDVLSQDLGGFKERFLPGAFTRSLRSGSDVKCTFNHDLSQLLGRTQNGTLKLQDDPDGLRFTCQLNPESTAHRDLHAAIRRGDINECSFAFVTDDTQHDVIEEQDEDDAANTDRAKRKTKRVNRRTVRTAKLLDVSAVTTPAYNKGTHVHARSVDYRFLGAVDEREEFRRRLAEIDDKFDNRAIDAEHRDRIRKLGYEIGRR